MVRVIEAYWRAINSTEELNLVTQDMLIGQSGQLEEFHWFVRAHLEAPDGSLTTGNASTEKTAAKRAKKRLPGAPRQVTWHPAQEPGPTGPAQPRRCDSVVVLTTTM